MSIDHRSHCAYLDAFRQFLQNGERSMLTPFLQGQRPEAFLSVYRNGFIRAGVSALESNFPSLVNLWGQAYFAQLASAYVNTAPPESATLIGYGFDNTAGTLSVSFAEFLQSHAVDLIRQYPYVPDICHLDQAWMTTLNADGRAFLSPDDVQALIHQGIDLSTFPMTPVDSAHLVSLEFDIFELWGNIRFGEVNTEQVIALSPPPRRNTVVFWQRALQVQAKPLSDAEVAFMHALKHTTDIDHAAQAAIALDEDFDIASLFAALLQAHLLKQQTHKTE